MAMDERDLLAKMLQAEAGNQGELGMLAVGSVIDNRRRAGNYGGSTYNDVLLAPGQFSPANSITGYAGGEQGVDLEALEASEAAYRTADQIMSGEYEDPTGGALNFYNPDISSPKWGGGDSWQRIGDHVFGTAGQGVGADPTSLTGSLPSPNRVPETLAYTEEQRDRLEQGRMSMDRGELDPLEMSAGVVKAANSATDYFGAMVEQNTGEPVQPTQPTQTVRSQPGRTSTAGFSLPSTGASTFIDTAGRMMNRQPPKPFQLSESTPTPFNPRTTRAFSGLNPDVVNQTADEALGAADGQAMMVISTMLNQAGVDYSLAETDVPATVSQAASVATSPPGGNGPKSRFDVEGYKRNFNRRMMAADALELLSVGLGQMSSGQGVNLSRVMQMQGERRAAFQQSMGGAIGVGGSIADLLIPGNERSLQEFLVENNADHLIPMTKMGHKYKELAIQEAMSYAVAAPERQKQAHRAETMATYYDNAGQPDVGARIRNDPAYAEAVYPSYVESTLSSGGWTPQASLDLANAYDKAEQPVLADLVREGGQTIYEEYLPQLGGFLEKAETTGVIGGMDKPQRYNFLVAKGVNPTLAANASESADLTQAEYENHIGEQRKAVARRTKVDNTLATAAPLALEAPEGSPLALLYDQVAANPETVPDEMVDELRRAMTQYARDTGAVLKPTEINRMAMEMGMGLGDPSLAGVRTGQAEATDNFKKKYEQWQKTQATADPVDAPLSMFALSTLVDSTMPEATRASGQRLLQAIEEAESPADREALQSQLLTLAGAAGEELAKAEGKAAGEGSAAIQFNVAKVDRLAENEPWLTIPKYYGIGVTQGVEKAREVYQANLETTAENNQRTAYAALGEVYADFYVDTVPAASELFRAATDKDTFEAAALTARTEQASLPDAASLARLRRTDPALAQQISAIHMEQAGNFMANPANKLAVETLTKQSIEEAAELTSAYNTREELANIQELAFSTKGEGITTGPGQRMFNTAQGYMNNVFGEEVFSELLATNDERALQGLLDRFTGENLFSFTGAKGVLSDTDVELIKSAFPQITDSTTKIAMLSQILSRNMEKKAIAAGARDEYVSMLANTDMEYNSKDMADLVFSRVQESGIENIRSVPFGQQLDVAPSEIIRLIDPKTGASEFFFYQDYATALEGMTNE